jgi:hypothetical protein
VRYRLLAAVVLMLTLTGCFERRPNIPGYQRKRIKQTAPQDGKCNPNMTCGLMPGEVKP